jgi:hypothetical protein
MMLYAWYLSYPLTVNTPTDIIFNQINWLYWPAFSLMLASLYLLSMNVKSYILKWFLSLGIVAVFFSLSYFYFMVPGSDSQYFRGLTENFINTKDLNPLSPSHYYYQWPAFFLMDYTTTTISALPTQYYEISLYAIMGFLLCTTLYVYVSKIFKNNAFVAIAAFFIAMFSWLNYQFAPFSFAFCFVVLVFMIEGQEKSKKITIIELIFSIGVSFAHAFVPLFLILFFLIRLLRERSNHYKILFFASVVSYFAIQLTIAPTSFFDSLNSVVTLSSEYSNIVSSTLNQASYQIDIYAQIVSRVVSLGLMAICGLGFVVLLIKRKTRHLDRTILLTGVLYSGAGVVLYTLGSRAIPVFFIPVCLGIAYLFERYKSILKYGFVILLVLCVCVPLHQTFGNTVQLQSEADYSAENFLIKNNGWTHYAFVVADYRVTTYIQPKIADLAYFAWEPKSAVNADVVLNNLTFEALLRQENVTLDNFNCLYDNGATTLHTKPHAYP